MSLTYNQVKAELDAASALTGGKFVPFDARWYVETYNDVQLIWENDGLDQDHSLANFNGDPLDHYVQYGAAAGFQPTEWFDNSYYRSRWPDTRNLGDADALVHYAKFGVNEGRAPNLAMELFDGTRYLAENPDVVPYVNANLSQFGGSASNGALAHYIKFGAGEQRMGYNLAGNPLQLAPFPTTAALAPVDAGNGIVKLSANTNNGETVLTGNKVSVDGTSSPTLRLVGDSAIRIDFTNKADQIEGLDLNGDGFISRNGVENNLRGANILTAKNFTAIDAYPRNPLNIGDRANNYTGSISYDGTGYNGDGVSTNGNIFLGGLGRDTALGGIGNDFLAGGGSIGGGNDALSGGRNADFFFLEASLLDPTDEPGINGGNTADDSAVGGVAFGSDTVSTQDTDWVLVEASDDEDGFNASVTAWGEIENVDASGDLYAFLNKTGATVGSRNDEVNDGRLPAHVFGAENYSVGSTSQLVMNGSDERNKLIGGYDNDRIRGLEDSDVIMGGKLSYLLNNRNNPNLLTADFKGLDLNVNSVGTVVDGRDELYGGAGSDGIVFEMDGGIVDGDNLIGVTGPGFATQIDGQSDTLYLTNFSMGRTKGWTTENEAASGSKGESDALAALTTDSVIRLDLGVGAGDRFRAYGGADVQNNFVAGETFTADQTKYKAGVDRTIVQDIENVIATGLGWAGDPGSVLDFLAAGGNSAADQVAKGFRNQQNFFGTTTAVYDLRGVDGDGNDGRTYNNLYTDPNFGFDPSGNSTANNFAGSDNTLYSGGKNDNLEGRGGDDKLMGGLGDDTFFVSLTRGDDFDVIHRQVDANNDNLWDRTFSQDFRVKGQNIAGTPTVITFNIENPDAVQGISVTYAGVSMTAGGVDVINATTLAGLATAINAAFQAIDKNVTAAVVGTKLVVTDAQGRNASSAAVAGDPAFKNGLESVVQGTGLSTTDEFDRLVFKAYQDAAANLGVDDTKNGLGGNAYAKDLVVDFSGGTTTLAERQEWRLQFQNLNQGDLVTVSINGKSFSATVGTNYDGSLIVNETTDDFVARFTQQFNARQLDIGSRAGDVTASWAALTDAFQFLPLADLAREAVLILEENETSHPDSREHVFMSTPVVTITNAGGSASGTVRIANTSDTSVELYQFDGRNGQLNANDVLFVGQTGASKNYDADGNSRTEDSGVNSWAVLQTAATAGGTLNGKDASVATISTLVTEMHGHDLLIGGDGNDVINGLGGDDTIVGSKGTDTVDGGQDAATTTKQRFIAGQGAITTDANANSRVDYNDTLLYREADFGDGSNFTVAVDGALTSRGKGTVTAVDSKGATLGVTSYNEIELVRTLNNTRADTLDFVALSNTVATTTGASAEANEGVVINLVTGNFDVRYNVDLNNDNAVAGTTEANVLVGRVSGVENLLGGNANDQVTMDETQLDAKNLVNLGSQLDDTTPAGTFAEGADTVTYVNTALVLADLSTVTIKPESASNTDTVTFSGGVLTSDAPDTLIGVEVLNVSAVAVNNKAADKLDLSGISGATVNFSTVNQNVAESLLGDQAPPSVAANEANVLEAGGVSRTGSGLGNELLEIVGIGQIEVVQGSTGTDRVLLGDANALANVNADPNVGALNGPAPIPDFQNVALGFNFHSRYNVATRTYSTTANVDNKGLYTFDLGDGDDTLDYRLTNNNDIGVAVDFTSTNTDWVVVDSVVGAGFGAGNIDGPSRVDKAVNVERFYGNVNQAGQSNAIDLSRATEAVTVTFGAEQAAASNEQTDPNGRNTTAAGINTGAATPANQVTGIAVATSANLSAPVARFMNASASAGGNGQALWNFVEGSNQAETVIMSATQDRINNETMNLRGGANTVDYTNGVQAGKNDTYLAAIGDATVTASTTVPHTNATVTHGDSDGNGGVDTITVDRQYSATKANTDGGLTLIGSVNTDDEISIAALLAPQSTGNIKGLVSTKGIATATEAAAVTDIMGTAGGGHNLVDLGSGAGVTSGSVIQDVKLNVNGQTNINDGVVTSIRGWEHLTGSNFNDRLFGNDNANTINGGTGADLLQGRGGGDTLTGDLGNDRFVYAGASETGHVLGKLFVADTAVDFVTDFDDAGVDTLVIDISAGQLNALANTKVFFQPALANLDLGANGAIVLMGALDPVPTSTDLTDMPTVVGSIGASATLAVAVNKGTQAILAVDGTDRVGIYLWTAGTVADTSISPNELQLLTVLDDDDIDAVDGIDVLSADDLTIRVGATTGKQTLNMNAGARDEVVYSALNQSQYGAIDSLGTQAVAATMFVSGQDKIDLSALNLGATNGLLINNIITIDRTGVGNQITDADATDFFFAVTGDPTTQQRAVVVEFDGDDIDAGTAGIQSRGRIFVDINGDGQLSTNNDMFIDFVSDLGVLAANAEVPVFTDFIFVI